MNLLHIVCHDLSRFIDLAQRPECLVIMEPLAGKLAAWMRATDGFVLCDEVPQLPGGPGRCDSPERP